MKHIYLVSALLILHACKPAGKGEFQVSGTIKNAKGLTVYLSSMGSPQEPARIIDSAILTDDKGSFRMKAKAEEESIYSLSFRNNANIFFINDGAAISIQSDYSNLRNFTITGSPATLSLNTFFKRLGEKIQAIDASGANLSALQQSKASDSIISQANILLKSSISNANAFLIDYLDTVKSAAAAVTVFGIATRNVTDEEHARLLKEVITRLVERFPSYAKLKLMQRDYDQLYAQMMGYIRPGEFAPVLEMPDTSGKAFSLTNLKGKYVLIDFWASWCGPCRAENPNVVKAYNQFKDKNFTVLGVSLDKEKSAWLQAIRADRLNWYHISDLKYWNSEAVSMYHFDGIPYNVLIDPEGKVIADNLRGSQLEAKLREAFK